MEYDTNTGSGAYGAKIQAVRQELLLFQATLGQASERLRKAENRLTPLAPVIATVNAQAEAAQQLVRTASDHQQTAGGRLASDAIISPNHGDMSDAVSDVANAGTYLGHAADNYEQVADITGYEEGQLHTAAEESGKDANELDKRLKAAATIIDLTGQIDTAIGQQGS